MKYVRESGVVTILSQDAEASIVHILRKDGVPISSTMLCLKGFLRRHRLSCRARTRQGQVTPEDANTTVISFGIEVQQKILE